jgi:hypothetical protein
MRPANRLETTGEKIVAGGLVAYLHTDKSGEGEVVQVALTPKAKSGSDFEALCRKLTVAINRALQGRS